MDFLNPVTLLGGPEALGKGPSTSPAKLPLFGSYQNMGLFMSITGGLTSAIGSFYAAKTAQYQAKSQALNFQFESDMAALNARSSEVSAQSSLEAGKQQVFQYTMQAGQKKAAALTSMAANGVVLGAGSAGEVAASMDIVKDIDKYTIDANAVREAAAKRTQATNYQNQSLLASTSATNMRRTADSISPFASGMTSLMGSATNIASQWAKSKADRWALLNGRGGYGFAIS